MSEAPSSLSQGRYALVELLGEGGMASVYRAFDRRLQTWRAIKLLSPHYSQHARLRQRFDVEAQTMARLEHRHIVRVYDVASDGPYTFIVMELVEGGSLVDWVLEHGPMPPRMAVEVTRQICAALEVAHARGVVHRDIKPHNVLVTAEGEIRITDFGIAHVGDTDLGHTKTGVVMGTWGFMAPEQRTDAKTVDARADVYATAATLYTLVTGRMAMDLFALEPNHDSFAGLDAQLVRLVLDGVAYHRDARIPSIGALDTRLEEVLPALPPLDPGTPPLSSGPRTPPPVPRQEDPVTAGELQDASSSSGRAAPTMAFGAEGAATPELRPSEAPTAAPPQRRRASLPPQDTLPSRDEVTLNAPTDAGEAPLHWGYLLAGALAVILAAIGAGFAIPWLLTAQSAPAPPPDEPVVTGTLVIEPPSPPQTEPAVEPAPSSTDPPVSPPQSAPPEPPAKAVPAPSPPPSPAAATPAPSSPIVSTAPPRPIPVVVVREPAPPAKVVVHTTSDPAAEAVESEEPVDDAIETTTAGPQQCIDVYAQPAARWGDEVRFRAQKCVLDDLPVTLYLRRKASTDAWIVVPMHGEATIYTADVRMHERFVGGLVYYVKTGEITAGSPQAPRVMRVE